MSADRAAGERGEELASIGSYCSPERVYQSCGFDWRLVDALGLRELPAVYEAAADGRDAAEATEATEAILLSQPLDRLSRRKRGVSYSNRHYAFLFAFQALRFENVAETVNGFELVASAARYRRSLE